MGKRGVPPPRNGISRKELPQNWKGMILWTAVSRGLHNHELPLSQRPRKTIKKIVRRQTKVGHDGKPKTVDHTIVQEGQKIDNIDRLLAAVREMDEPEPATEGKLMVMDARVRYTPKVPPECYTFAIVLIEPDGRDTTFVGAAWLNKADFMQVDVKKGVGMARSRAMQQCNHAKNKKNENVVPTEVRAAVSLWVNAVSDEVAAIILADLKDTELAGEPVVGEKASAETVVDRVISVKDKEEHVHQMDA